MNKVLNSMLVILLSVCGWAQSTPNVPVQKSDIPPFVDWEANVIYRSSNAPMKHFFNCLDTLIMWGNKKVSILHIGDSHIQGGFFTNEVRVQFQRMRLLGNGGLGLIFPYKIAHTNGPWYYTTRWSGTWKTINIVNNHPRASLGLTGYTGVTHDTTAYIKIFANNKGPNPRYAITAVRILHETGPTSLDPYLPYAQPVAVTKDSLSTTFILTEPTDTVTIGFRRNDPQQEAFTLFGFVIQNRAPGVVYHSVGVNGADLPAYLQANYLIAHTRLVDPDLIIISLGTNDAYRRDFDPKSFRAHYHTLLTRLKDAAPNASILLTTPGDSYRYGRYYNSNNLKARNVILDLAKAHNLAVWDFYSVMGGPNSVYKWYKNGLATYDKIHFTRKGYRLQGKLLYEAIMRAYYDYLDDKESP